MKLAKVFLLFSLILFANNAIAAEMLLEKQEDEIRAKNLFSQIKCTVCSGQSIKESNAEIALMMRKSIRTQISQGKTDQEIIDFLEGKYGEAINLAPKADRKNIFLWLIPGIFIGVGVYVLSRNINIRNTC